MTVWLLWWRITRRLGLKLGSGAMKKNFQSILAKIQEFTMLLCIATSQPDLMVRPWHLKIVFAKFTNGTEKAIYHVPCRWPNRI